MVSESLLSCILSFLRHLKNKWLWMSLRGHSRQARSQGMCRGESRTPGNPRHCTQTHTHIQTGFIQKFPEYVDCDHIIKWCVIVHLFSCVYPWIFTKKNIWRPSVVCYNFMIAFCHPYCACLLLFASFASASNNVCWAYTLLYYWMPVVDAVFPICLSYSYKRTKFG